MNTIDGVLVTMSEGSYVPMIQLVEDGRRVLCDYRSRAAMEAGLSDPRHWAHDVYRTLERLCRENQRELQGND